MSETKNHIITVTNGDALEYLEKFVGRVQAMIERVKELEGSRLFSETRPDGDEGLLFYGVAKDIRRRTRRFLREYTEESSELGVLVDRVAELMIIHARRTDESFPDPEACDT